MKTTININRHIIATNKKLDQDNPPISVKTYKSNEYAAKVAILDKMGNVVGEIAYARKSPLKCGATCWFEAYYGYKIIK